MISAKDGIERKRTRRMIKKGMLHIKKIDRRLSIRRKWGILNKRAGWLRIKRESMAWIKK